MSGRQAPTLPKLQSDWASARHTGPGWPQFLEAVYLDGIRGWAQQWVEFRFPVVAIAGENGSGKSTILKAAAAAYRPPAASELIPPKDFSPDDFFPSTPWETVSGVRLEYRVRQGDNVSTHSVRKASARWRGMPERPIRRLHFLDISRTQPVDTLIGYGKVARVELAKAQQLEINDDYRGMLSRVLGRTYDAGSLIRDERGKQIGIVEHGGNVYSNFHQGAGEDATTDLVALLQEAPRNSLVLIDEVEASLHPRAQRRLMTELIHVATVRRLQLIVSTHSPYVLEQLPPEARIYLRATRDGRREPIYGVTPEYALSLMDDEQHPELFVYCEDDRVVPMIEGMIRLTDPSLLDRIKVVPVGPAGTVRILGGLAQGQRLPEVGIGILDADQDAAPGCLVLPGQRKAPERNVFEDMTEAHLATVAERLGVRAGDLMDAVEDALRLPDHHAWAQRTAERLGGTMRTTKVWEAFVDVWVNDVLAAGDRATFVHELATGVPPIQGASATATP